MWLARDFNGDLFLYNVKIKRGKTQWLPIPCNGNVIDHCIRIDNDLFPDLTWDDNPIEVELIKKVN